MKKVKYCLALILSFILCFSLSGCKEYTWQFEQSIENVEKIEIVILKVPNLNDKVDSNFILTDIKVIMIINKADYEEVIFDIQKLTMGFYFGEPMSIGGKGFKITFKNGDFDFITDWEPAHFYKRESEYFIDYTRWSIKNSEKLKELLAKWSE